MNKSISQAVSKGLVLLALASAGHTAYAATGGVAYRVAWGSTDNRYHIYMKPSSTPSPDLSMTGQVTLRVPHSTGANAFTATNVQAKANTIWSLSSTVPAPTEDTSVDYLSFTYSPIDVKAMAFQADTEQEVFSFKNTGPCTGDVTLMDNNSDPFNQPPSNPTNSAGTNPGNQFANAGWGTTDDNDYTGNYGGAASCSSGSTAAASAQADSYPIPQDSIAVSLGVLANDNVPSGQTVTIAITTAAAHGTAVAKGSFVEYTPTAGYSGADSFTYSITDANGVTTSSNVSLTVQASSTGGGSAAPANPQANNLYYRIGWNSADQRYHVFMYPGSVPSTNESLSGQVTLKVPDAAAFQATDIQSPLSGVTWSQSSAVKMPTEDASSDYLSFTFNTSNPGAFNWTAGTELEVFSFADKNTCSGQALTLLENASDPFNQPPSNPSNSAGTNPGNSFSNLGWGASDANDYAGNYGSPAVCSLPPPVAAASAQADKYTVTQDGGAASFDILSNDSVPSGQNVTLAIVTPPTNGKAVVNGNQVTYTPNAGYSGTDSFKYGITDANGAETEATVSITVQAKGTGGGTTASRVAVPTLSEWAQILLSVLLGAVALGRVVRKPQV